MVSSQKYNLRRALDGILDGTFRSARHAAKAIGNIHHSTIARNLKRHIGTSGGHEKALNLEQEIALKSYCDRCITLGSYAMYKHIRLAANSILRYAGSSKKVSRDWVTRFIRKTPKYRFKKSRSIGAACRVAAKKAEIVEHFRRFEAVCNEKKIKKQNIWNFDATGFRIGCLGSQLVLRWAEQK
ncbi:hypothetical protein K3495_g6658 [Podosphaera aphanis]|nr:hypothetical protein K3495_g6658 [Podosphaera aphanis]